MFEMPLSHSSFLFVTLHLCPAPLFLHLDLSCSSSRSCSPWFQGKSFPIRVKWPQPKRGLAWWWVFPDWWKESLARVLTNVWFLQMMALCFILVLGSFSSCLSPLSPLSETSPLSSSSHPSSPEPPPSADLYTTQGRSRTIHVLPLLTFVYCCGFRIMHKVYIFWNYCFLDELLIFLNEKNTPRILDCRRFFYKTVCNCCDATHCKMTLKYFKYACTDSVFLILT